MKKEELKEERAVLDLKLYAACKEIFDLLSEHEVNHIELKNMKVSGNIISQRLVYTDASEGPYYAWSKVAKRQKNGSIRRRPILSFIDESVFVHGYENHYRDELLEALTSGTTEDSTEKSK